MKKATYFSDAAMAAIAPDERGLESFSGRVGFLITAGVAAASEACPALTRNEWLALADANNGTVLDYSIGYEHPISGVTLNLYDSAPELDEKWGISCADLARRIRGMPLVEQLAIFEVVRRFWRTEAEGVVGRDDFLQRAGANVAPARGEAGGG